jgi:hypothetical protein
MVLRHSLTHSDPGNGHTGLGCLAQPFLTQFPEEYLRAGQGHHGQGHLTRVQSLELVFCEKRDADLEQ